MVVKTNRGWFNELSTISDLPLLDAVPLIGGVAGFINSFFFSNDASPKPLKFQGSLELEGSITGLPDLLISDDFILNPNASPTSQYYIPLNDFSLGVFNLVDKPIIQWDAESQYFNPPARIYYYAIRLKNQLNYTFNHDAGLNIISMNAGFTFSDHEPFESENPILLESLVYGGVYDITSEAPNSNNIILPSGIFIEIKFQTESSKNNGNEITILKNFPLTISAESGSLFGSVSVNPQELNSLFEVPDVITLNQQSDYETYSFENLALAANKIEAGDNFYVGDNLNNADLVAGNEIILTPGFQANYGSTFHAVVPSFTDLENGRLSEASQNIFELPHSSYFKNFNTISYASDPDFRDLEVIYTNELSLEDADVNDKETLLIYPNPNSGNMNIEYFINSKNSKLNLEVINQNGSRVYFERREFINEGTHQIPLSLDDFSEGVYFLRITSDSGYRTGRILIVE